LILVVMWAYTVLALQFIYAIFAAWSIFLVYEIVAIGLGATPLPILISNNFFFLSANIIGMVACYLIEYYKRKGYCQRLWLEEERAKTDGLLLQLRDELILAGEVQKNLLPPPALNWDDRELICYLKPSQQVGGDFYSYHEFNDGRFALALGDVAGHGVPAALLMATCISLYGATLSQDLDPCDLLARLDSDLEPYVERNHQNCAFCYLVIQHGELFAANAGGIPPFIHHADGAVEHLKVGGFPLGHGLGKSYGYQGVQAQLHPGDSIVLVSDGAIETIGKNGEMYGFKRLEDTLAQTPGGSARAIADHLITDLGAFTDNSVSQDDLTIAILTITA
jgi:sigma-B regulation protein RsbU (phosphoserine phosphatase)